jgi:hypothetical protein
METINATTAIKGWQMVPGVPQVNVDQIRSNNNVLLLMKNGNGRGCTWHHKCVSFTKDACFGLAAFPGRFQFFLGSLYAKTQR